MFMYNQDEVSNGISGKNTKGHFITITKKLVPLAQFHIIPSDLRTCSNGWDLSVAKDTTGLVEFCDLS
jgi:hypothetical protein